MLDVEREYAIITSPTNGGCMYKIVFGKSVTSAKSYATACLILVDHFAAAASLLQTPLPRRFLKSPKSVTHLNEQRKALADKLSSVKLPAKAGGVSGKIAGLSWAILKE